MYYPDVCVGRDDHEGGLPTTLNIDDSLHAPNQFTSASGSLRVQIQGDGNSVVYEGDSTVLWASNTASSGDVHWTCRVTGM